MSSVRLCVQDAVRLAALYGANFAAFYSKPIFSLFKSHVCLNSLTPLFPTGSQLSFIALPPFAETVKTAVIFPVFRANFYKKSIDKRL
jgi:hypothetical protein